MATITSKISGATASRGPDGEVTLAAGRRSAMRMWKNEQPGTPKPASTRPYETLGYVIAGRAELHIGESVLMLEPGDSYVVPEGASHTYEILESFTAVETTTPSEA